jgi:lysophospholipase L1-like esterase
MKVNRRLLLGIFGLAMGSPLVWAESPKADVKVEASEAKPRSCIPVDKNHKRHEGFLKDKEDALKKGPIGVVFVGDSITDGWRGKNGKSTYDKAFGDYNPYNIGISGEHTEDVLWRLENGEIDGYEAKLFVMMIGTNNLAHPPQQTPEEVIEGIRCLVKTIEAKQPKAKILLLGIFPRGAEASDPFRAKIKQVNEAVAKLDDGGQRVRFLDIGDKFLAEDGKLPKDVMPDSLHPNSKGYEIWGAAIKPAVDEMMK